jgi:hypothetical protein
MKRSPVTTARTFLLCLLALGFRGQARLCSQDFELSGRINAREVTGIETEITSLSGESLFINVGRDNGVRIGDIVQFNLNNGERCQLTVDTLSASNARCLLTQQDNMLSTGTKGIVFISPAAAPAADPSPAGFGERLTPLLPAEAEPPRLPSDWTCPPEQWDLEQPLLAPPRAIAPAEREPRYHGRIFSQYLHTWNWQFVDNQYSLARIGTDFWIDNAFRRGNGIHFRGDVDWRGTDVFDGHSDLDTIGRIDLLSCYGGGGPDRPLRFEVGRFLPCDFPEFGFLDGADFSWQATEQNRFGFGVGTLPEPFAALPSGNDLQGSVSWNFCPGPEERFLFGIGYQKTWHDGVPDRDLIVTRADIRPNDRFNAYATLWMDYYGKADSLKPGGLEITEAIYNQHLFLTPRLGLGSYYTQIRWPQLLRREIDPIFDLQIIRNRRRNYGGHAWFDLSPRLRLNARLDLWENEDSFGGTTWETEMVLRQLWGAPLDLACAFLTTDGLYSSGPGGRISLSGYFPRGLASLTYTVGDYRLTEESDQLISQAVIATLDFYNSAGRSFSVYGDYRFGEAQDAASLGVIWRQQIR